MQLRTLPKDEARKERIEYLQQVHDTPERLRKSLDYLKTYEENAMKDIELLEEILEKSK